MFIAALFIVTKRKQAKCLSKDEQINRMWYIHTTDYYSAMKRKEVLIFDTAWMNREDIMLNKISQTQEDKYFVSTKST